LEVVEVLFDNCSGPHKVSLTSISLTEPAPDELWNLKPSFGSKLVEMPAAPGGPKKIDVFTCSTPEEREEARAFNTAELTKARNSSAFTQAIFMIETYPSRTHRVEHLLEAPLVEFLNSIEFQYSATGFGNHPNIGWVDWRAIYPWTVEVIGQANEKAKLSPELCINDEIYAALIKRFDNSNSSGSGQFLNNTPRSENILPFAKFAVTLLYLELQEETRKRVERETLTRDILEREGLKEGNPRVMALWDTEDSLDLHVRLPDTFGELNFRQQYLESEVDVSGESMEALPRPAESICWPAFDPQATGKEAVKCPPVGEYSVWLHMSARKSTGPCTWACQVVVDDCPQIFGGTWKEGDSENIDITTFAFSMPK